MTFILVTLKTVDQELDLKIPNYLTGQELLHLLPEIHLTATAESQIQAEPLGRILDPQQTLVDEGVETGALLTVL